MSIFTAFALFRLYRRWRERRCDIDLCLHLAAEGIAAVAVVLVAVVALLTRISDTIAAVGLRAVAAAPVGECIIVLISSVAFLGGFNDAIAAGTHALAAHTSALAAVGVGGALCTLTVDTQRSLAFGIGGAELSVFLLAIHRAAIAIHPVAVIAEFPAFHQAVATGRGLGSCRRGSPEQAAGR